MVRVRWGVVGFGLLTACGGSSGNTQAQIDRVHGELVNDEARLAQVRVEIAKSEAAAERAQQKAAFEECRSDQATIRADASIAVAHCHELSAQHAECEAHNESHTAETSIAGCAFGLLFAGVTGGAGTPAALIGCGAGGLAGAATTDDCPAAACSEDPAAALRSALAMHQRSAYPVCGGELGVTLPYSGRGATVSWVQPGGSAAQAGIAPGDVIVAIGGEATPAFYDVVRVLEAHPPLDVVRVDFVRQGRPFATFAVLAPRRR